jgi:protein MpaA
VRNEISSFRILIFAMKRLNLVLLVALLGALTARVGAQTSQTNPSATAPDSAPISGAGPVLNPTPLATPATTPTATARSLETIETFGASVEKRPLTAHILGDGPNVTMILACVHGNETSTPGVARLLREHLLRHPEILAGRRVVLISVMNPDGLARKTRRNAHDVDINRNYPGTWRRAGRGDSFKSGPSVASEPETRAMMKLVAKYKPQKIVSIHQPLNCMAYSGARSRNLALAMQKQNGFHMAEGIGYPTPGGFGGYCNLILKVPVVTLELPWQSAEAAWKINATALIAAIRF